MPAYLSTRFYTVFFTLLLLAGFCCGQVPNQSPDTLKIVTCNLYGRPNSEWPARQQIILDELAALQPDIIALQEVILPGANEKDRASILADSLYRLTGSSYQHRFTRTHFSWDTWDEGIAILSRHIILDSEAIDLPAGLFPRKVLWARILSSAGIINFFDTHLSFGNQEPVRIMQVEAIQNVIREKSADGVAVANFLAGDFNAVPGSAPILLLTDAQDPSAVFLDSWAEANPGQPGFTVPSDNPSARIDFVFLREGDMAEVGDSKRILSEPNPEGLYASDHLGVMSTFQTTNLKQAISLISPLAAETVSGITTISWSIESQIDTPNVIIFFSHDAGRTWQELWSGESPDTSYLWDTTLMPDGTRYLLRIAVSGESGFGMAQSKGTFTINNPGNAAPEVMLQTPRGGEVFRGNQAVRWFAADPDGDPITVTLDISLDGGVSWQRLASDQSNLGEYTWDTRIYPNSSFYMMRVTAAEVELAASDTSGLFTVDNERSSITDSLFRHIAGTGSGALRGNIFDPAQLTGHLYRITFDDTTGSRTTYDVFDIDTDSQVVRHAISLDGVTEGPAFDGIRLVIFDYPAPAFNRAESGWLNSKTNLIPAVSVAVVNVGGETIEGIAYPADYQITIFEEVVDTSSTFLGAPAVPMRFKVMNLSENRPAEVIFLEADNNNTISRNDQLYILEKDNDDKLALTWFISFSGPQNPILPQPGDQFRLVTFKPFTYRDVFEFTAAPTSLGEAPANTSPATVQLFQNYPNPFNPTTSIRYQIPQASKVIVKIYNILGQEVRTLVDEVQVAGNKKVTWDGTDNSQLKVSSGVYIIRLSVTRSPSGNHRHTMRSRKMLLLK